MKLEPKIFERYFNKSYPVGPIVAPAFDSSSQIQSIIFDEGNEIYQSMDQGRTLIIGRKGSGKTSLLNSAALEGKDAIYIPLDPGQMADVFTRIVEEIEKLSSDTALVEQVSKLWEVLVWGVIFRKLYDTYGDKLIGSYIDGFGIRTVGGAPYELINQQINVIKQFPPAERPVPQKVRYTKINGLTFLEVKQQALKLLDSKKKTVFVLMDSLEDYVLHKFEHSAALSGLLRCVGEFNEERTPCVFRCCIPAEKYHDLLALSQNPIKDFQGSHLLHWDASDLAQLSARRYANYLSYYEPALFRDIIAGIDLRTRKGAFAFWRKIFPDSLKNKNGFEERPIAYMMRHTQLLPRHFLMILTEVLQRSLKTDNAAHNVSRDNIIAGVLAAEERIKDQILEAYDKTPTRNMKEACVQVLPSLKSHFTWQEFDQVVGRRSGALKSLDGVEVMQLLLEVGAVGKHVASTEKYHVAVFEYMVPHRLIASVRDTFCVHPLFTQAYSVQSKYNGAKPIYTYWSEEIPDDLA